MSVLTKGLAMDWEREGKSEMAVTSIWPAVVSAELPRCLMLLYNPRWFYRRQASLTVHNSELKRIHRQSNRQPRTQNTRKTFANQ